MGMDFIQKLPTPAEIREQYPVPPALAALKKQRDKEITDVLTGQSDKLLVIIGPCSADNEDAVCDYVDRLAKVNEKVNDRLLVIPRIYTNKPRTTGEGYKGIVHQPDPSKKPDLLQGIVAMRKMHIHAMDVSGLTAADEMLYPENYRYVFDFLSYVAIGARSVEDQLHRLTVSGFDVPAGMKNPTSGDLTVMMNSVYAAQHPHTFTYRGWEVKTTGNPLAHTVLIDTNHSNSGKKYEQQIRIVKEVMHSRKVNPDIHSLVKGVMIESYIEEGNQKIGEGIYGKSITDPCLGWADSEKLLYELAELNV